MATISSSIQILGGMTSAFNSMNRSMTIVLNSFEAMQRASGNAIDISSIIAARQELSRVENAVNAIERGIREANDAQNQLNNGFTDGLASKVKNVIGKSLSIDGIKKGVAIVSDFLSSADVLNTAETKLANVMGNNGATQSEYESIRAKASEVGNKSTFGNAAMLAGSGEIGSYLQSGEAIEAMMDTMADYAAGMGGINVDDGQMVEFAGQLGNALNGQYLDLQRNGFEVSEAQKKIIENGTEMEKVAVISDIIGQSWDGLAEAMANTPQGQIVQMANNFEEVKQKVGNELYDAVLKFVGIINSNMPQIEAIMLNFAEAVNIVIDLIGGLFNVASDVLSFILDNWSLIAPVIFGITAAVLAYTAALEINKLVGIAQAVWMGIRILATGLLTATTWGGVQATLSATAAQWGLNAALMANPIMLVVLGVILLIAVFYLVIAAINKFAGTSYDATAMVAGAFAVMGAFIANVFFGLLEIVFGVVEFIYNSWITFANFFGNIMNDPVAAIIHLFGDLGDNVLGVIEKIASALDFVFGTNMASTVAGWRSSLGELVNWAAEEYGNGSYEVLYDELDMNSVLADLGVSLDRFSYSNAWEAGKGWGSNLFAKDEKEDKYKKEDKYENILNNARDTFEPLNENGNRTAANTEKMANSMEATEEDLKYLRDVAEQEAINRFTTADIKVDFSSTNTINSNLDLDGIIDQFTEKLEEAMDIAAEGA